MVLDLVKGREYGLGEKGTRGVYLGIDQTLSTDHVFAVGPQMREDHRGRFIALVYIHDDHIVINSDSAKRGSVDLSPRAVVSTVYLHSDMPCLRPEFERMEKIIHDVGRGAA